MRLSRIALFAAAIRLSFFTLLFASSTFMAAQDETPTAVTVQNRTGDLPFSQTVGTGAEHVDIGSGNLIVDIPIISTPGRHSESC